MEQFFIYILFFIWNQNATFCKYVYIANGMNWQQAQKYCQDLYTDLAPVSNEEDMARFWELADNTSTDIWIGLERSSKNTETWMWSGGGEVSKFYWGPGQPEDQKGKDVGLLHNSMWADANAGQSLPFFCYRVVVVNETMAWEDALQYCRENHHSLASVASETEMLLIQKELDKYVTTEQVWMGLRFLPGQWLWVDGRPLSYEAWGREEKPACPDVTIKCGALTLEYGTQSQNGGSALVQVGPVEVKSGPLGGAVVDTGLSSNGSNKPASEKQMKWEPHDCKERLSFVCY